MNFQNEIYKNSINNFANFLFPIMIVSHFFFSTTKNLALSFFRIMLTHKLNFI